MFFQTKEFYYQVIWEYNIIWENKDLSLLQDF